MRITGGKMFSSDILEVATGIVFIFVLVSTICSAVREGLEAWLKTRAAYLEHGLRELLHDKDGTGLVQALFNHPLIFGLFAGEYTPRKAIARPTLLRGGRNLPSYIPSRSFALALLDIAANGPVQQTASSTSKTPPKTPTGAVAAAAPGGAPAQTASAEVPLSLAQIRARVAKLDNQPVRRALLMAIDGAYGDLERARTNIETWYNCTMERVSGWYKRSTQRILFWVAAVLVVGLNINTLTIADALYRHPTERNTIVATVEHAPLQQTGAGSAFSDAQQRLLAMHLPLGWGLPRTPQETAQASGTQISVSLPLVQRKLLLWDDLFQPLVGWLITIFAATLGAPFWFDVLNKIAALRSTVKPWAGSAGEPSTESPHVPAPQPAAPILAAVQQVSPPAAEADLDTCSVTGGTPTPDAQLPAAQGGVAA